MCTFQLYFHLVQLYFRTTLYRQILQFKLV